MAQLFANAARSTLTASITSSATQLQINPADQALFPVATGADWFKVALEDSTGNIEYIRAQRAVGQSLLTITERATEDATKFPARAFVAGSLVELRMTAADLASSIAHPSVGTGAHAASAIIVAPVGGIAASNVQEALQELDTEVATALAGKASLGANTFTGAQTLPGNAVNALEAVPKQQLDAAFANRYLPGERVELYRPTIPAGVNLLKADGTAVNVFTYANLAAAIYCGDANNATASWGYRCTDSANPSTTRSTTGGFIVLPDPRGRFGRALSDGSALDSGRSLWAYQDPFAGSFTWRIQSDDGDGQTGTLRSVLGFGINGDERYASNYGPGGYSDTVTTVVTPGDTRGANDAFLVCIGY